MEHSLEDALLIFDKWKNESAVIGIVTFVANLEIRIKGVILHADRDALRISCGEDNLVVIKLDDCLFRYGDPREFPEISKRPQDQTYKSFVSIQYPEHTLIVLFEANLAAL